MSIRRLLAVAALAGATLCLESALTRLLAVTQFYHFAFLVISLALLGFAASGSLLSVSLRWQASDPQRLLAGSGIAFAGSVGLAYLVVNYLPFDSYAIAIDRRQVVYFGLYYLGLSLPFLCSGLGIAAALASGGQRSHTVYAANLLGSAGGALLAPGLMLLAGVPGALLGSALLGLLPGMLSGSRRFRGRRVMIAAIFSSGVLALIWLSAANLSLALAAGAGDLKLQKPGIRPFAPGLPAGTGPLECHLPPGCGRRSRDTRSTGLELYLPRHPARTAWPFD